MAIYKGVVTQGGADTFAAATVETGLTVDGKAGWQINSFKAFSTALYLAAATDYLSSCVLATIATSTLMTSDDEIARLAWAVANTAGVAVAYPIEPIKDILLTEPRVTVQPEIYVHASSVTTGVTNSFYFEIEYEIVKLSDLEVLRLLAGGA